MGKSIFKTQKTIWQLLDHPSMFPSHVSIGGRGWTAPHFRVSHWGGGDRGGHSTMEVPPWGLFPPLHRHLPAYNCLIYGIFLLMLCYKMSLSWISVFKKPLTAQYTIQSYCRDVSRGIPPPTWPNPPLESPPRWKVNGKPWGGGTLGFGP